MLAATAASRPPVASTIDPVLANPALGERLAGGFLHGRNRDQRQHRRDQIIIGGFGDSLLKAINALKSDLVNCHRISRISSVSQTITETPYSITGISDRDSVAVFGECTGTVVGVFLVDKLSYAGFKH